MPKIGEYVKINDIKGKVKSINIFNGTYKVELNNKELIELSCEE